MLRRHVAPALVLISSGLALPLALDEPAEAGPRSLADVAASATARGTMTRIDGSLRMRLRTSAQGFVWSRSRGVLRDVPAVVRFDELPSPARLAELEARGVRFASTTPTISGAFRVRLDEHAIDVLEGAPDVARVSSDAFVHAPRPADLETALGTIRAVASIEALRAKDGTELDGRGTVIGDLDSDVFVFHPAFFRPDAGYHAFVDVDGDGKLTVDVDGVDLDGDGTIAPGEVLHREKQALLDYYSSKQIAWSDIAPERDVLFLDANGNGKRDYGAAFPESTPGYGEPMFVADDVDRDGVLRTTEKLARLGTSKVKGVLSDAEYLRGSAKKPLSKYLPDAGSGSADEWFAAAGHGTATTGVLVGGTAGQSLRGVAPGADVLVATSGREDVVTGLQWLVDQGANVLLTEYAPWVAVSLDGSSEVEAFLDAAKKKGILTASPAGNLGGSMKHVTIAAKTGSNVVSVETDGTFESSRALYFSFHHTGGARKIVPRVRWSGGAWVTVPVDPNGVSLGSGIYGASTVNVSPRGTHELHVFLGKQSGALPSSGWEVDLGLDDGAPLRIEGYVSDEVSGWSGGAWFTQGSDAYTICNPATADAAIRIGAFALNDAPAARTSAGDILSYSSRGPLLRGGDGIDLGAPTDAISTLPPLDKGAMGWMPFGGTSGAGPHVAGTIALMRQAFPDASADELKAKLLAGTASDAMVTRAGPTAFGRGRLDVAGALGIAPSTGTAPSVVPVTENAGTSKPTLRLEITDDEAAETMRVRWDLDYDGVPDTEWEPLAARSFEGASVGPQWVKVDVLDRQGHVTSATATFDVGTTPPPGDAAAASAGDDSGCGCRTAPGGAGVGSGVLALATVASLVARRRRRAPKAGTVDEAWCPRPGSSTRPKASSSPRSST